MSLININFSNLPYNVEMLNYLQEFLFLVYAPKVMFGILFLTWNGLLSAHPWHAASILLRQLYRVASIFSLLPDQKCLHVARKFLLVAHELFFLTNNMKSILLSASV